MTQETAVGFSTAVSNGALRCEVIGGAAKQTRLSIFYRDRPIVVDIPVGLRVDGEDLGLDAELVHAARASITDSYEMRTGKAAGRHHVAHEELTLRLRSASTGAEWELLVRAAPDGAAFRYRVPAGPSATVDGELTAIPVPDGARAWPLLYQTWYETPRFGADIAQLAEGDYGFPFLLRDTNGVYVLLSEAAIDGRFSGSHLAFSRAGGSARLSYAAADPAVEIAGGAALPWRVFVIGSAADVVASSLVDDLAPAADAALAAAAWIRPGHAAWSWWSDTDSPEDFDTQRRYVDYAAARGWEHVLVDAGWNADWVPQLVEYADARNVGIFLWSHWIDLQGEEAVRKLALWKSWGIAGVKVDFMESESQERYRWYDFIIAEAAQRELMLNFHGSVIPRGWARTFPHVMSYEGIRGAEYYIIDLGPLTAAHNVIQPFTRNVAGSMDYTPVTFSAADRETSDGHELGLAVAFESGITHLADDIAEYAKRPLAEEFLSSLPPVWHETRLLSGSPDTEAVVARRHHGTWYLGCIAVGPARTVAIDLEELYDGDCDVWIVGDAVHQSGLVERRWSRATGRIELEIAENGGFAGVASASAR
ncbi:glycoside hydrolase family 97 catalytic domain-containing protein [Gryllotalpicola reticulitermitis]|uniref:Glycoside hydrolase family 97 catalytic domain-containing protein n=1 Tax=Gryllotalpicola reticulitermitis TaxID=1184153 RepID=A0ABV8Q7G5_9MICO